MPNDCRAKCSGCYGSGRDCPQCEGRGLVCPVCRGMRFTHRDVGLGDPDFGKALRCGACCEGNQVNPSKEARVIVTYLASYIPARETPPPGAPARRPAD